MRPALSGNNSHVSALEAAHLDAAVVLGRIAGATGLGMLLGVERELDGHEAGVRTHALLALGAAVFGVISVGAFGQFAVVGKPANITVDVSRVAAYVSAGVGFLGAGTILKTGDHIKGLTTAASLWVAAAVGLAAGVGLWSAAVAGALLAFAALVAERPFAWLSTRLRSRRRDTEPPER
ncbi:MAG TPA: MgtC/SapB family protein [Acidimicrobiia bacterium]